VNARRLALVAYVTLLSGFGVWGFSAALIRDVDFTDLRIVETVTVALLAGGALYAGLALLRRVESPTFPWLLIAATPLEFGLVAAGVWSSSFTIDLGRWPETALVLLVASLLAATLRLLVRLDRQPVRLVFIGFVASDAAAGAVVLKSVWGSGAGESDARIFTVFAVLTVFAYLLAPAVQWLQDESAS
jgi:hypothetical protein